MAEHKYLDVAKRFFDAYNASDASNITEVVDSDLLWAHSNRFKGQRRDALLKSIEEYSANVPGRAFSAPARWALNGNVLFLEHKWEGVPAIDVPGFGWKAGTRASLDCLSVLVFDEKDRIVEWTDYA
ncbi:hypothetical protein N7533_002044 [Penicillium manginii]|jgi:hypothetical protein|uniref:uncharacterized protein n=1 Tax=Penicillium manginii TaxID=203109 RepID=UPI0025476290|nr:uncharacterized protein N7533_002044 [Penicillium manginii]KAJ5763363.1 hypothetical protein N7533_002044 [Penicillium manginii]